MTDSMRFVQPDLRAGFMLITSGPPFRSAAPTSRSDHATALDQSRGAWAMRKAPWASDFPSGQLSSSQTAAPATGRPLAASTTEPASETPASSCRSRGWAVCSSDARSGA